MGVAERNEEVRREEKMGIFLVSESIWDWQELELPSPSTLSTISLSLSTKNIHNVRAPLARRQTGSV